MKTLKNLTILYVENEKLILEKYSPFLETHCDKLYIASDGREAYSIYIDKKPHIVIMDLYLSKFDDITLAKKIREKDDDTSLIALTKQADRETLFEIIDLHFSSYLVKPVDRTKLLDALLRVSRKVNGNELIYLKQNCCWDERSKTLFYEDRQVFLTKREQKLFELLIKKRGTPCSDNEIFFYVWDDNFNNNITNASIRTLIKNLRKKIPKELIENQYGIGYKINL